MTPGQMKDLISAVTQGIPSNLSFEIARKLIGEKKKIAREVRKLFLSKESYDYVKLVAEWESFYRRLFGKEYDFSSIIISEKPNVGRWRLLIIVDLTLEQLYAKCKELFQGKCWRWTDDNLDKKVVWNERDAKNGAYAIWVKDEVEADENLKNNSTNDIKAKDIMTETLAERLIHELKFFDETGGHLDINNWTLCSGSRYVDDLVPCVRWDSDDKLYVHWCNSVSTHDDLRSRQVVS
jgi:hypothetical protein